MIINFNNKYNIGDEVIIKEGGRKNPNTGWFPDDEGHSVLRVIRYKIIDITVSVKTLELTYRLDAIKEDWQPEMANYAFVKEYQIIGLSKNFSLLEYIGAIKNREE